MTREEAIAILEDNKPSIIFEDEKLQKESADISIALDMAISALEQEPLDAKSLEHIVDDMKKMDFREAIIKVMAMVLPNMELEPCEDAISRAEAQTAIMASPKHAQFGGDIWIKAEDAIQIIQALPSVQPSSKECRTLDEFIEDMRGTE